MLLTTSTCAGLAETLSSSPAIGTPAADVSVNCWVKLEVSVIGLVDGDGVAIGMVNQEPVSERWVMCETTVAGSHRNSSGPPAMRVGVAMAMPALPIGVQA